MRIAYLLKIYHDILLHAAAQFPAKIANGAVMPEAPRYDTADLPRPTPARLPVDASWGAHG